MTQPKPTRDPRLLSAEELADLRAAFDRSDEIRAALGDTPKEIAESSHRLLLSHIAAQENMLVAFRQAAVLDEKSSDLRSLLIECDSELSAQGHGRPPSPSEHLLDLSRRLRSAYDTRR